MMQIVFNQRLQLLGGLYLSGQQARFAGGSLVG